MRYVEPDPSPPLGAIVAVVVVLGTAVRRAHRDWRLLCGVATAFVLFAVPPSTTAGLLCGAVAETFLLTTIWSELVRRSRPRRAVQRPGLVGVSSDG